MAVFSFGFSPCPNDTFAFWAAVHGQIELSGVSFDPVLADIEALDQRAIAGEGLAVTKLSVPALAHVTADYAVLPSGSALGFGVGPLVVCRDDARLSGLEDLGAARVAIPGRNTTAFLLLAMLCPAMPRECVVMRFDEIMPAVAAGAVDAGVVIHEGRFTYRAQQLRQLVDLGELFEQQTGGPLPLGVIAARREVGHDAFEAIGEALRASVRCARQAPERPRAYVREHAQELADDVCDQHIALYVNDFTEDLGVPGRSAIERLLERGRELGLLPPGGSAFRGGA